MSVAKKLVVHQTMIVRKSDCSEYAPCIIASIFVTIVLIVIVAILFRGSGRHHEVNYDKHPRNLDKFVGGTDVVINETRVVTLENGLQVEVKPIGYATTSTTTITPKESKGQLIEAKVIENGKVRPMTKVEEDFFSETILNQLARMKEIQDMLDQNIGAAGPQVIEGGASGKKVDS